MVAAAAALASAVWAILLTAAARPVRGEFMSTNYAGYNAGKLGHRPLHRFRSSPETAPVLQVNVWNESRRATTTTKAAGSHIFLRHDAAGGGANSSSPLVLDAGDLTAVYVNHSFENVFGTRVQENLGKRYLTFWAGRKGEGIGDGFGLAYDDSYRLVYNVSTRGVRTHADLHEFAFTGHGTALITGVDRKRVDTSDWEEWEGRRHFPVLDAMFQEIDLETNEVLFTWKALDHIDPTDSLEPWGREWDAYHLNSIQKVTSPRTKKPKMTPSPGTYPAPVILTNNHPQTQAGNYLISIRHTQSLHLIDGQTGDILWTLGGKRNDFVELPPSPQGGGAAAAPLAPLLSMGWQHHARFVPGTGETELTLFDNHVKQTTHGACEDGACSRGLHVRIDAAASPPTAQLLGEYLHPSRLQAQSQGSVQPLFSSGGSGGSGEGEGEGDGSGSGKPVLESFFIGWGRCPSFTEHDAATGEALLDVQFSPWHSDDITDALDNYRAYRLDWRATPWWPPSLALAASAEGDLDVFASWNGATEVASWVVRGVVVRGGTGTGTDDTDDGNDNNNNVTTVNGDGEVLARSRRTGFETKLTVGAFGLWYLWAEALDASGAVLGATRVVNLEDGSATVLPYERDEYVDADNDDDEESAAGMWAMLAGGVVGLVLVAVGGKLLWMRARGYKLVYDDDDDIDIDMDSDSDVESISGLDLFTNDLGPEAWQEYAPRSGPTLAGVRVEG